MLKVLTSYLMLYAFIWLVPCRFLWSMTFTYSFLLALINSTLLPDFIARLLFNVTIDLYTPPLFGLACWFLPLSILASQELMFTDSPLQQRQHLALLISVQMMLIMFFDMG